LKGTSDYVSNVDNSNQEREFLFGLSLSLGKASNNYAEYTGIILAQMIFTMFK